MGEGVVSGEISKSLVGMMKSVLSQGRRASQPGGIRVSMRKGDPKTVLFI